MGPRGATSISSSADALHYSERVEADEAGCHKTAYVQSPAFMLFVP